MSEPFLPPLWSADTDASSFPARFEAAFGRKLRVLHIGNIANYAYVNTKIQRQAGVDAECVDPNFFHIMASPEWLEAPVKGDYGDDFAPKWSKVNTGNYQRPDWFIQGDEALVFRYLLARARHDHRQARQLRRQIEIHRRTFTNDTPLPEGLFQKLLTSNHVLARLLKRQVKAFLSRNSAVADAVQPSFDALPSYAHEPPIEVQYYMSRSHLFAQALSTYDVIQGYTIQGVYPAAAGLPNFTSYELGTIRGLPFEDTPMGRLTRWTYLVSPEVFITNIDCLNAAVRLGLEPERTNKALHAFDVDEAVAFARNWQTEHGSEPKAEKPVFYAPARQHWKDGNDSILKGNDIALHGAALLKARGYDFTLVMGEWGSEVELSKALVHDLDLETHVQWARPLPRHTLWPTYMRACAVIDQFRSPAFGGVSLEAMALGKRLITGYDHSFGQEYFSSTPPIMNCRTAEAVANAMEACLNDLDDRQGLGEKAQAWMLVEHSVERQLREQFTVYERLLSSLDYREGRWHSRPSPENDPTPLGPPSSDISSCAA